jgi:hypothetical protein
MSDSAFRDVLITAAGDRKLVALHYLTGVFEGERVPAVVIGLVVKVSARVVVVATASKNETVVPLEHVTRVDGVSGAASVVESTSTEAA